MTALEPGRFWDAFARAGFLKPAVFHLRARAGRPARDVPLPVDRIALAAAAFDGVAQGEQVRLEYPVELLPDLALDDHVTVNDRRYRVASHPEPLSDGDYALVELGAPR
ncbi:head-tail joining protein [Cupriavidus malaysiensis]|uniref:Uncharacterized protein n=1 Tax=Cupriavidus malaysiensis TaxID=367825 RepID=A0ABN4TMW0_9BURK|nr:hypothetical protein [Cupriavidus malaysiensis]AOZ05961.1 hypothetical protein BKK80_09065 [Cupriavidus malaysiensis]